jgi:hypothetical protein
MENKVFTYLELALSIHSCVIIPELGGFIVNPEEWLPDSGRGIPGFTIVFNPDLKHDDGILISYYKRDENISYNAASQKVKDFVKILKQELLNEGTVHCGRLGTLSVSAGGRLIFEPGKTFIYPDFYGLSALRLNYLSEISRERDIQRRYFPVKYTIGSIAAAVAAIFLFTVPSVNVGNTSGNNTIQQSGFIYSLSESGKPLPVVDSGEFLKPEIESVNTEIKASLRTYYIIVGGDDSNSQARQLLGRARENGLKNADIIESGGRFRIYVASFSDKAEAEDFLEIFRKENPKYETAWLYSQRNL